MENPIRLIRRTANSRSFHTLDIRIFSHPWSYPNWEGAFSTPASANYFIIHGEKIMGMITSRIMENGRHEPSHAELDKIGILPSFRNRGLGRLAMEAFHQILKNRNIQWVYLEVSSRNLPAVALYRKVGYEIYRERKKYYPDGSNALCMKKTIQNIV